jgi:hypothetical protein
MPRPIGGPRCLPRRVTVQHDHEDCTMNRVARSKVARRIERWLRRLHEGSEDCRLGARAAFEILNSDTYKLPQIPGIQRKKPSRLGKGAAANLLSNMFAGGCHSERCSFKDGVLDSCLTSTSKPAIVSRIARLVAVSRVWTSPFTRAARSGQRVRPKSWHLDALLRRASWCQNSQAPRPKIGLDGANLRQQRRANMPRKPA